MATSTDTKDCILCRQDMDIFAVGKCDHPVCYRCSTKMRVLYEQKFCSVCREELDEVVFTKTPSAFSSLVADRRRLRHEREHGIYFPDGHTYARFKSLLRAECPRCPVGPSRPVFSSLAYLEQHMRRLHDLQCCDVCARHLKVFPSERRWYGRKELALHHRGGDRDGANSGHRGHPLCGFCDVRYLDQDELAQHARRDHFVCPFCEPSATSGVLQAYQDYERLRAHFKEEHFLCEEGDCAKQRFINAFRTELDLEAHRAATHRATLDVENDDNFPILGDPVATPDVYTARPLRPRGPTNYSSLLSSNSDNDFPALRGSATFPTLISRTPTWVRGKAPREKEPPPQPVKEDARLPQDNSHKPLHVVRDAEEVPSLESIGRMLLR